MAKIFISYRRDDSAYPTQMIHKDLANHFGFESVVFDIDTIPPGVNFREYLNKQVSECNILLAIIGDQWVDILNQRLDEPDDFVRIEIQAALERQIPVVPILVGKASVPSKQNLPPELVGLSDSQATEVRAGADLPAHIKRLIDGLERLLAEQKAEEERKRKEAKATIEPKPPEPSKKFKAVKFGAVAGVIVLLVVGIWWYISDRQMKEDRIMLEKQRYERLKEEEKIAKLEPTIEKADLGMKFVLIPAGSFLMGSQISPEEAARRYGGEAKWSKDEHPPHLVEITKPFYLQTTEVSQAQWKKVMGDNPSKFKDCGDHCPVERVSWYDAQKFINKLNQMEGKNKYRLPTEAEWEYACRAGKKTVFAFGDDVIQLGEYAWYFDNSKGKTKPVGKRRPNAWGLYDMHGNVWEWCQDWYDDYPSNSVTDPIGPDKGEERVLRGGSWHDNSWSLRSANRGGYNPGDRSHSLSEYGFRVARDF